jgi:hypothetical protein
MLKIEWFNDEGYEKQIIHLDSEREALEFLRGLEEGGAKKIIITKYPPKVFVSAMMWDGLIEEINVFRDLTKAETYKKESDKKWAHDSNYEGIYIFERIIE